MNTKQRLRRGLALATVVGAVAAPAASAYPIDPVLPGASPDGVVLGHDGSKAEPIHPSVTPETSTVSSDGFDWGDAGIGAASTLALAAIAGGAAVVFRHRPRRETVGYRAR